jgi:short-subunit dehydrogenase
MPSGWTSWSPSFAPAAPNAWRSPATWPTRAAVNALADAALQAWGGADVVINNAGVGLVAPVHSLDGRCALAHEHQLLGGGPRQSAPLCRSCRARPGSVIVNISSIFAMVSMPTQSIYNASKAAVRGFSDALREELRASGVRVLCVHPGGIQTRIAQQARLGDISAVADTPQALHAQFDQAARTTAPQAALAIVQALQSGRTRLLIGADAKLGDLLYRLWPTRAAPWLSALARRMRQRQAGA